MERAMSLGAVPDDDEVLIGGMWVQGRQLRAVSGKPVTWVTDKPLLSAGVDWTELGEESAESGLQPFLLSGLDGGTARPWDTGEQVGEPEDAEGIDQMDIAHMLEGWWDFPSGELAEDEELRGLLAPFGARFPGLAPAVEEEMDPELMRRALYQYTRAARIGLVPAARPADILPSLGWQGAFERWTASGSPGSYGRGRPGSARGCSRWASPTSGSWSAGRRRPWRLRSGSLPSTSCSAKRPIRARAASAGSRVPW
jgi:hypothetical protein